MTSKNLAALSGAIEIWDIDNVIPYDGNAKKHPPEQIEKLAEHIKKIGWDQQIVVDKDGVIIKGHGRRAAAISLGLKKVPVLVRRDLSPKEVAAARIADNGLSTLGDFDPELLAREIQAMMAIDETDVEFSIDDLGFDSSSFDLPGDSDDDVAQLLGSPPGNVATAPATEKDYSKPDVTTFDTYRELRQLVVDCKDEADQQRAYELMIKEGYVCRPLTL